MYMRVYVYTCPCAEVNAVSGWFFREGGRRPKAPFPNIVSSRLQHANSVYN